MFLELPAGLVDAKEQPIAAALRELFEETGYRGDVIEQGCEIQFGMAVSSTSSKVFTVACDLSDPVNQAPQQHLEPDEHICVVLLPFDNMLAALSG